MAPEREVVRVFEIDGPRGGKLLVHVLECGCSHTVGGRARPKKRVRCVSCLVRAEVAAQQLGVPVNDMVMVSGATNDGYVNALRNCLALARRQLRGEQGALPWHDIVRFCDEAGIKPTVLRDVSGVQVAVLADEDDVDA